MESFKSIRERFQGSAQRSARATKPSLESEVPATLGGANAEPESLKRSAPVDVAALLDEAAEQGGRPLDWRNSAEDLLRALGVVSGLAEREALSEELGYTGDKRDVAAMDTWLRKALLSALAESEGRIPPGMLD